MDTPGIPVRKQGPKKKIVIKESFFRPTYGSMRQIIIQCPECGITQTVRLGDKSPVDGTYNVSVVGTGKPQFYINLRTDVFEHHARLCKPHKGERSLDKQTITNRYLIKEN